jgi:uncharacterized protein
VHPMRRTVEHVMAVAEFRFYGPLNDFLLSRRRQVAIRRDVADGQTIKDAIEALGVPHPEVALVTANGLTVDFAYRVCDGDRIAVYPAFVSIAPWAGTVIGAAATPGLSVEPERFVVDGHLGRLAAYLRILGFDTWYQVHAADAELAERAGAEDRVLLTRDRGLLKRSVVRRGYFVRSDRPADQLVEVIGRFELAPAARPFGRCLRCNGVLEAVAAEAVASRVPPRVRREQHECRRGVAEDGPRRPSRALASRRRR